MNDQLHAVRVRCYVLIREANNLASSSTMRGTTPGALWMDRASTLNQLLIGSRDLSEDLAAQILEAAADTLNDQLETVRRRARLSNRLAQLATSVLSWRGPRGH